MEKTVGVVLPTYNQGKYLQECLASILAQSHPVSHILVCDDHSTDNTTELLDEFQRMYPGRISVVRHEVNGGSPAKTINTGLRLTTDDYVSVLAGDDRWHPDFVLRHLEALEKRPGTRFAYCGTLAIKEDGTPLYDYTYYTVPQEGNILAPTLARSNRIGGWMIENTLLKETGLYDESLLATCDWDFNIRLASKSEAAFVPELVYEYRLSPHGFARLQKTEETLRAWKYVYRTHARLIRSLPLMEKFPVWERKRRNFFSAYSKLAEQTQNPFRALGYRLQARLNWIPWKCLERFDRWRRA